MAGVDCKYTSILLLYKPGTTGVVSRLTGAATLVLIIDADINDDRIPPVLPCKLENSVISVPPPEIKKKKNAVKMIIRLIKLALASRNAANKKVRGRLEALRTSYNFLK